VACLELPNLAIRDSPNINHSNGRMIADAKYERAFVEERDCKSPGFNSLNDRLWNDRSWRKAVVRAGCWT